jgi:hypothetical protein
MQMMISSFALVSPLWALISVALGAADLPGSDFTLALGFVTLGISLFLISLAAIIRRRTA